MHLLGIGAGVAGILAAVALVVVPVPERPAGLLPTEILIVNELAELALAQQQFAAGGHVDTDGDGTGEFGFLGELAGSARLRIDADGHLAAAPLPEPMLPLPFAAIARRCATVHGYHVQVFLPGRDGAWAAEAQDGGGAGAAVDPQLAAQRFLALAWPARDGRGQRAFALVDGRVLATDPAGGTWRGLEARPQPGDAVGGDDRLWEQVR